MNLKKLNILNISIRKLGIYILLFELLSTMLLLYEVLHVDFVEDTTYYIISIAAFFFLVFNMLIYIFLYKKINEPISYLTQIMREFQKTNSIKNIEKKEFYQDEMGEMIEQFFLMQEHIENQKNILVHLNKNLKETVAERVEDLDTKNTEMKHLMNAFDKNIIASKTDLKGIITYASEAFCNICGYSQEELLGKPHSVVRHADMPKEAFAKLWQDIKDGKTWEGEVKNRKKNGGFYWVFAVVSPEYNNKGEHIGYSAIRHDITAQKEVEALSANLEQKVEEQTKNLQIQKQFVETILNSQEQIIVTTDGKQLTSVNETFLDFFAVDSIDQFTKEYSAECICDTFNTESPQDFLRSKMGYKSWIDFIISRSAFGEIHKAMITRGNTDFIFSVTGAKLPGKGGQKSAVFTDITDIERAKREIEIIHKRTDESIKYAALIQSGLIPYNTKARQYFKDYFAIWHPKDIVSGDIYLFENLRDEGECILMVIDCTGHGVPGAFVTMLVKAIERQIVSKIKHSKEIVSPAHILQIFNKNMKQLLNQNDISSISNSGFDGQIMYYNKKESILKVASARNEIFYYQNDKLHTIKGNRHSIGYKDSDINFQFTEHTIDISQETIIYLFTDGYWDQNGGEKNLPFGKKRLKSLLNKIHNESMADQQEELLYAQQSYQGDRETTDDITIVGMKI